MEGVVEAGTVYFFRAVAATGAQAFALLGPALLFGVTMHFLARFIERRACTLMGQTAYLALFGWLGTSVHEIGHAAFCAAFGHKIVEMRLFDPNPETGTLGYVRHTYNRSNLIHVIGNFFIGVGPIILGSAAVYLIALGLVGQAAFEPIQEVQIDAAAFSSPEAVGATMGSLWRATISTVKRMTTAEYLTEWRFHLFVYLVFSIGAAVSLSGSDLRVAADGAILVLVIWFAFNLATNWFAGPMTWLFVQVGASLGGVYSVMLIALILNALVAGVLLASSVVGKIAGS